MEKDCRTCFYNLKGEDCCLVCGDDYSQWMGKPDTIDHPTHYTTGSIETIDIIKDTVENFESYLHGNIIKYISRYRHKNGIEDLKKAKVYLDWLIKEVEK